MKAAFFVGVFPSLSETFILNQITGLIDLGCELEIFAWRGGEEKDIHNDVIKYELLKKVNYCNMPSNIIMRVLKAFCLFVRHCPRHGIILFRSLNMFRYGKEASSLRLFFLVVIFLNKTPDILHCHYGFNGTLGVYLKELGLVRRVVTTFHAYDISEFVARYGKNIYKNLFCKGDVFLPVSNYWKQRLIELGGNQERIKVHHMGVDINKFQYYEPSEKFLKPIKLLTVGRLVEKKGHEYAIRAVAQLLKKGKSIIYMIVGDGPLRSSLEELAVTQGVRAQVQFLGALAQEEVAKLYREVHGFILPSITTSWGEKEGIPVVLMEAQASGVPIIATYHSGIPELVRDSQSGFLVPEKDIDALVEKIDYLLNHPQIWLKVGKVGRQIVEEEYNIRILNQELLEIYQHVLAG